MSKTGAEIYGYIGKIQQKSEAMLKKITPVFVLIINVLVPFVGVLTKIIRDFSP